MAENPYDRTDVLRRDAWDEGYQQALDDIEMARDKIAAQSEDAAAYRAELRRAGEVRG